MRRGAHGPKSGLKAHAAKSACADWGRQRARGRRTLRRPLVTRYSLLTSRDSALRIPHSSRPARAGPVGGFGVLLAQFLLQLLQLLAYLHDLVVQGELAVDQLALATGGGSTTTTSASSRRWRWSCR